MPKISKNASVMISIALAAAFIVIFAAMMFLIPSFAENAPFFRELYGYFCAKDIAGVSGGILFFVWAYSVCTVGEACCIVVLLLLLRVRKSLVFTEKSVSFIRFVSWGCLFLSALFALAQYFHPMAFIGALAAAFLGLCLRVVKNVVETATAIKDENDLTV